MTTGAPGDAKNADHPACVICGGPLPPAHWIMNDSTSPVWLDGGICPPCTGDIKDYLGKKVSSGKRNRIEKAFRRRIDVAKQVYLTYRNLDEIELFTFNPLDFPIFQELGVSGK